MTNPTPLSSAALEVLDAYMNNCGWLDGPLDRDYRCVAAVLRAAADQVVPKEKTGGKMFAWQHERLAQRLITRDCILTIAAELEGADG